MKKFLATLFGLSIAGVLSAQVYMAAPFQNQYHTQVVLSNYVIAASATNNFSSINASPSQIFQLSGTSQTALALGIKLNCQQPNASGNTNLTLTILPGITCPNYTTLQNGTNSLTGAVNTNAAVSTGYMWLTNNAYTVTVVAYGTNEFNYLVLVTNSPNVNALLFSTIGNNSTNPVQLTLVDGNWH